MILILPSQSLVLNAYAVLAGSTPGNAAFKDHQDFINTAGVGEAGYKAALNNLVDGVPTSTLASTMLTNLGLGSFFTQADAEAFLTANAGNRAGAMIDLAKALYNLTPTDPIGLAAVTAYRAKVDGSYAFSNNAANVNGQALDNTVGDGQTFALTAGLDNLVGSAFNDNFVARTINNGNTLQDGDQIDGGAGSDTLYVDFTNLGNAITPVLKNIESVVIRAQTTTADATNGGNVNSGAFGALVQVDAQRSLAVDVADHVTADFGVTRWESNNSRSDVVIEDVRIGNLQKTSDVTIAMVETDPGNVDFAVYFDQQSLRNASTGTSTLTIQIMDSGAAAAAATSATPLLNNPYDTFKIGINGNLVSIALDLVAVAAADTYEALLAVFQTALVGTGVTASLTGTFTITDPISAKAVTGKNIVLSGSGAAAISDMAGAGWFNTTGASVPATSNIFTSFSSGATNVTELVTSKVLLDDVGRSNMGGDLVIGGMSTGDTSNYTIYRGVERFEITVGDNSKLQTINSTNNALREVTIVSGATSRSPTVATDAYTTTVLNEGDLTVNGDANAIATAGGAQSGGNAQLPGVENNSPIGVHHGAGAAGFTDVRLIDGSAFKGKLAFTAAITGDVINKYITSVDTAANPGADVAGSGNVNFNVKGANFIYTGGNDNDTMVVSIDAAAASSRSTVVSGQSDFTFNFSGGEGNDAITATIINPALAGGAQAWYTNQQLNANITINAGAGNDTIKTPGAGDVIIDAGDGNDTVYTDNTGALAAAAAATGTAGTMAVAYANAAAAELAAGLAANAASSSTGFVLVDGSATGVAVSVAAAAAALNTLNLITPDGTHAAVVAAGGAIPVHSVLIAGINAATAAGGLTLAQNIALQAAYGNWSTAGVVTPVATLVAQTITAGTVVPDGTVVTEAQYNAGNDLLASYIATAKATAAAATANDAIVAVGAAYNATGANAAGELLNDTQQIVVARTEAVNKVFDPSAGAIGLTYTPVVTQGANEINTFTAAALVAGATTIINGLTFTAAVGGATAAQVQTAMSGGAVAGGVLTGANNAGLWTVAAGAGTNLVYTSVATGNPADLADTGTSAIPVVVTAATAETVAVTITGVAGGAGETVTFDGITHAVGGLAPAAVAALINGNADGPNWTDASAGAVVTFSSVTLGNVADLTTASLVTGNPGAAAGTQTTVNNLAALNTALAVGATDAAVVTALKAAINNGSITAAQAAQLFTAATSIGVNAITAGVAVDLCCIELILTPLQTAAANLNTAAQTALTTAIANDTVNATSAVNTVAQAVGLNPTDSVAFNLASPNPGDEAGTAQTAAAVTTATAAVTAAQNTLTPLTTQAANLAALKAAIAVGTTDLAVVTATANAVANGSITAANKITIDGNAGAAVPAVAGTVVAAEKTAVDLTITALQLTNETAVASQTKVVADLQAIVAATTTAAAIAAAAGASGGANATTAAPKAVYVFNTDGQGTAYNRLTQDQRNLDDLKSDVNNSHNFFNTTVKVTYKGIDASLIVAGTGAKTTDLEINQAIKNAINTHAVLSKLLVATDGPANTLVVTSLIDGTHALTNLAVTVTLPTAVSASDLATAVTAGVVPATATSADLLAVMTAAKTAFDAKGDYSTQWAESGAAGGNTNLVGANSTSSSDNTVTPGNGDDVIVLGTTVGTDLLTSSNEVVVYAGTFGNDTIVNFAASGLGIDQLNFSALNGRASAFGSLSADKSIVVGAPAATALTAVQIAALFTDSATAINHVYVAVDTNNIGSIWQVADAAGTAATGVVATLVGSIDLADTTWSTLTAANFV